MITKEQLEAVGIFLASPTALAKINALISSEPAEEYITAEMARALGLGNAEWLSFDGVWRVCDKTCVYALDPKYRAIKQPKLKQLDWSKVPVGVMTNKGELRGVCVYKDSLGPRIDVEVPYFSAVEVLFGSSGGVATETHDLRIVRIAPADKQRWIAVQDDESSRLYEGLVYQRVDSDDELVAYKVIGLAPGYADGGEA